MLLQLSGRRWLVVMALVALVIGIGATVMAESASSGGKSPQTITTVAAPPKLVKGKLGFGISYGDTLTWRSDKDLAQALDDAISIGATWIRVDLSWNDIQPDSPAKYMWQRFDRVASAAQDRALNVLATIAYTPRWARVQGCTTGPQCAPTSSSAFAAFALAAAKRYAPMGVHTWEVWNEPNDGFWAPRPDPAAYTTLLKSTASALREGDPQAFVMMAGLSAANSDAAKSRISPIDFLIDVFKLGGDRAVDAIAYHPYNGQYLPSARTAFGTAYEKIDSTKISLASVLADFDVPDMPIWITETGAPTNAPGPVADGRTFQPTAQHVTEVFQARIASDAVATLADDPHVATLFWYSDRDAALPNDFSDIAAFFGLRRYDGSKKPAYDAFKQAIAAYDKAHP